ncbi:hypothetical protein JYU34_000458 [Plutella xylostella]|uniref:PH domain-containing protein n=1 Tax=Plutella xylostella TaxID=51655 RepID=A0ABQ7R7R2_PLUXY|nr:hypothetical protein JYU34_000458 [Plutella xylostella]
MFCSPCSCVSHLFSKAIRRPNTKKMSKHIVFEGWLTKSPPSKRIWRAKWRKRWFVLRQSGELPGQYFLDYYADRNRRRMKGTINLDLCEQVDAGLHMERGTGTSLDPKVRGSVFTVRTTTRIYHLEADSEDDMEKWVAAICRVCGLHATDETRERMGPYQNSIPPMSVAHDQYDVSDNGVYIRISDCITGIRPQDRRAFTFDDEDLIESSKSFERDYCGRHPLSYLQPQPEIRVYAPTTPETPPTAIYRAATASCSVSTGASTSGQASMVAQDSDEESYASEEEDPDNLSLLEGHVNIIYPTDPDWDITLSRTTFTRHRPLSAPKPAPAPAAASAPAVVTKQPPPQPPPQPQPQPQPSCSHYPTTNGLATEPKFIGPPVPPRPPKPFQGPKLQEPTETENAAAAPPQPMSYLTVPGRRSQSSPASPGRALAVAPSHSRDDDEEMACAAPSSHYFNLTLPMPPAVDRALKPRHSSHSFGHLSHIPPGGYPDPPRSDVLQYLDLDFQTNRPPMKPADVAKRKAAIAEAKSTYKTVDFVKTEAFNSTREDAEAFRLHQQ